jgi:LCP family protein required for cell wall assembly
VGTIARAAAGIVSAAILGAAGVSAYTSHTLTENITPLTLPVTAPSQNPPSAQFDSTTHASNILLIGSDARDGKNRKYGNPIVHDTARADTTMLILLPPGRAHVDVISIPRDLIVDIPTHIKACSPGDNVTAHPTRDRFNAAYQINGATCTVATATDLLSVPVHHAISVDFTGFTKVVDALGGLRVCVTKPVKDPDAKLNIVAGTHMLSGADVLALARARKTLSDGSDTSRIDRQQYILTEFVQQYSGLTTNPLVAWEVATTLTRALSADIALRDPGVLVDAATQLSSLTAGDVRSHTVPYRPDPDDPFVTLVPDGPGITSLMSGILAPASVPKATPRGDTAPVTTRDTVKPVGSLGIFCAAP